MKCVNDIVDGSFSKYYSNLLQSEDTQVWFVFALRWAQYPLLPMALNTRPISETVLQRGTVWASLNDILGTLKSSLAVCTNPA